MDAIYSIINKSSFNGVPYNVILILLLFPYFISTQDRNMIVTKIPALHAYHEGFAYDVMQSPFGEGVRLNDNVLIENDGSGAGLSLKGTYLEPLHKDIIVRKEFLLDNPASRHVNIFEHEVIEVYIDELGKWVLVDPESIYDSYEFNNKTGMPLDALEQHEFFLMELGFSKSNKINWTVPEAWAGNAKDVEKFPQPLNFSTFTDYVNWYDAATPHKLQYALNIDRKVDFYPTLNRMEFTSTYGKTKGKSRFG